MSSTRTVVAFDLYGTLLSTESTAAELSKHFGQDEAATIAATWRKYQLEYTWRLNSMGKTQSFSSVTKSSLLHALEEIGVSLDEKHVSALIEAYDYLPTFPDVLPALKLLATRKDIIMPIIFSNGTQQMVANSVRLSPDLGPYGDVFEKIITVEGVQKFKPAPEVYFHLAEETGKGKNPDSMSAMWLVSGNPFDVVGARAVGMKAAWVDRKGHHSSGNGWCDKLVPRDQGPTIIVKSLEELVKAFDEQD